MSREDPQMKLRLPEALRDRIRSSAEENGRSMNAEIVGALSRAYPRSVGAVETARDIFGYFMHYNSKFKDDDAAVIEEMFSELFNEISKLEQYQKYLGPEAPESAANEPA